MKKRVFSSLLAGIVSAAALTTAPGITSNAAAASSSENIYQGHTYAVFNDQMTWTEAEEVCEEKGGHLVTINSAGEQRFVEKLIKYEKDFAYYIGLSSFEGNWEWVDRTPLTYKNYDQLTWAPEYGEEYCCQMWSRNRTYDDWYATQGCWDDCRDDGSTYADHSDESLHGFICEWDKKVSVPADKSDKKSFTLMIYLCGSDLETNYKESSGNLRELINSYSGGNTKIVVQTGGSKKWSYNGVSAKKNQRWLVQNKKLKLIDDSIGQKNMGDSETLSSFIQFSKKKYPADRYGLVLIDHGGAIFGICSDDNYKMDNLGLLELNNALQKGGTHFDFIGMDACLMANLETVLTVANYTDYLVASETLSYTPGWDYTGWIKNLCKHPGADTETICKNITDDYCDRMRKNNQITGASVIDTKMVVKTVLPALNDLSRSLDKKLSAKSFPLFARHKLNANVASVSSEYMLLDIKDFCNLIISDTKTYETKSYKLLTALNKAIVYSNKTGYSYTMTGLSITFPADLNALANNAIDGVIGVYDQLGYNTKSYTGFIKHYANVLAGAYQYYSNEDANKVFPKTKWLNKKQFFSVNDYKKNMLSTADNPIPIDFIDGNIPLVSYDDASGDLIYNFGVNVWLTSAGQYPVYSLGNDSTVWIYENEGWRLDINNTWVTLNGVVIPMNLMSYEDIDNERYEYFYFPCTISGKDAILYFLKVSYYDSENNSYVSDFNILGYGYLDSKGNASTMSPVTSGMKVTPYYLALDKEGNETYILGTKSIRIKSKNSFAYSDISGFVGNNHYLTRLFFQDVFGIYHYSQYAESDTAFNYYNINKPTQTKTANKYKKLKYNTDFASSDPGWIWINYDKTEFEDNISGMRYDMYIIDKNGNIVETIVSNHQINIAYNDDWDITTCCYRSDPTGMVVNIPCLSRDYSGNKIRLVVHMNYRSPDEKGYKGEEMVYDYTYNVNKNGKVFINGKDALMNIDY